jgi:hypothetical protein
MSRFGLSVLNAFAASTIRFCHVEIEPQTAPANVLGSDGGADCAVWIDGLDAGAVVGPAVGELSEQAASTRPATSR